MPAQPLVVAAAAPLSLAGDVSGNAITHAVLIRAAAARVVVFPELSLTGYHLDAAALSPDDSRISPIVEACAATGSTALVGAPVGTNGRRQRRRALRIVGDLGVPVLLASFAGSTGDYPRAAARSSIWSAAGALLAEAGTEPGVFVRATLH